MEFLIGAILLVIVVSIILLLFRRRLYNSVDYYEEWKLQIMNRNVGAELSKMKSLNLKGDTKNKFEHWQAKWDEIVYNELSKTEEELYEAEHYIDGFRFKSANTTLSQIDHRLEKVDGEIDVILSELEKLIKIEETIRKEEGKIRPRLIEAKSTLSSLSTKYDRARPRFSAQIKDLEAKLDEYDDTIEEGNYEDGQDLVKEIQNKLTHFEEEIAIFPNLYDRCKTSLPNKLDAVLAQYKQIENKGYHVEHLQYDKELKNHFTQLLDCVNYLEEDGVEDIASTADTIEERIDEMLENINREEEDKEYIETKLPTYEQMLNRMTAHFGKTKEEVEELKSSYYLEDDDQDLYQSIHKVIEQCNEEYEYFANRITKHQDAHTVLRTELEDKLQELEDLEERHEQFKENIKNLRKDELDARNQLESMYDRLNETRRKLRLSNLPGIPNHIWILIEESQTKNEKVIEALEEQPLDMVDVQKRLSHANQALEDVMNQTDFMIDQAKLTEHVIQYANRYRSKYPILNAQLREAERLFRAAEYELSLEKAAQAVEEVEPGALKRIEKYQQTTVS
ncbi:MAG TPA: septation ring formation regulator EzrA [Pseudogracilibacillus sp.]|nr:septation ring formation regulator EzrA [Pseudogracilibacillus sp.]